MAGAPPRSLWRIYSAHGDPIRIVPLHTTEAAQTPTTEVALLAPTAPPQLTYRSGPLLTHVEVSTVFWGPAWQNARKALARQLNEFFDVNGEIGDICAWKTKRLGPHTVQLEWSNDTNKCT